MQHSNKINIIIDEDYQILQNEYSGTEQLHEILHFLDLAFPEWKTNEGLGVGAPEFVLWVVNHTIEACHTNSMREYLKLLYIEIADSYQTSKEFHTNSFKENCYCDFIQMDDDLFFEKFETDFESLSDFQIDDLFKKYHSDKLTQEPFNFKFEMDIPWELSLL